MLALKSKVFPAFSLSQFRDLIHEQVEAIKVSTYEPTGIQEDIIIPFGMPEHSIVLVICANKVGKSGTAVNILKNVFWPNDKTWFNYPMYNNWPYPKKGRIIGTVKNTADDGPIRTEILKWWPKDGYQSIKGSKHYHSIYETNTGFDFDVMTYDQHPEEFEGPLLGWTWCDEPPPSKIVGAITSRFAFGGKWIITATPIKCGAFLDTLNDLEEKGKKIKTVTASIQENSVTSGKPNHLGTKRGLMTDEQIADYISGIPLDERDARIRGIASNKSGKVYSMFSRDVHVRDFDVMSPYARSWNCFCTMDPHRKFFPFIQWWAVAPDEKYILYNEWPSKELLGSYYDEARTTKICPYTVEQLSQFIKILDYTQLGLHMFKRVMDPWFAKSTENEFGKNTESLQIEYAKHGLIFELPPPGEVYKQVDKIQRLLNYEKTLPINQFNEPSIFIMPHCVNSIRAFERHHIEEGTENESEEFKDPITCALFFFAMPGNTRWVNPLEKRKKEVVVEDVVGGELVAGMADITI